MSKPLFDNEHSDSDTEWKADNEYAKNYNKWRKSEELHKLQARYGEDAELSDEDSSSSSDDEDAIEMTKQVEQDFFKTLSCLKSKDPSVYDEKVSFFESSKTSTIKSKSDKTEPMFLKDYERKLLLEKQGKLSDDDENYEEDPRSKSPTYIEEQKLLKENLKNALKVVQEDETEENWGGMFKTRQKTKEETVREDEDYKAWLAGQQENLDDTEIKSTLQPLKDYWNNPALDDGEKFLRDYILNKKFLEKENEDYIPTYDEVVHDSDGDLSEDEQNIDKQEEFEHKYNFRFEEPDTEFIKRYPRTIENSVRKTDDKRSVKRAETKERKRKEKEQKFEDISKMKEFKRKEIEEKIEKLKEITGNKDMIFQEDDIDGDFDPDAHDRRMQDLFSNDYYEGPEEEQKPIFADEEDMEIENWNNWARQNEERNSPHCEDDNFIMDCDYDPSTSTQKQVIEDSKGKKKRRRKSKFAKVLAEPKPIFDPNDKTFEQFLDEYYQLDCEDIIDDIPCRFKYRKVVPNDFGLSLGEILSAKDKELNKWCSIKKAVQIRPDHIEKYDQIAFAKKGNNQELKRKILPSLFSNEKEPEDIKEKPSQNSVNKVNKRKRKNDSSEGRDLSNNTESEEKLPSKKPKPDQTQEKDKSRTSTMEFRAGVSEINSTLPVNKPSRKKKRKSKAKKIVHKTISIKAETTKISTSTVDKVSKKKKQKASNVKQKVDEAISSNIKAEDSEKYTASKLDKPSKNNKRKSSNGKQKVDEKMAGTVEKKKHFKLKKEKPKSNLEKLSDARLTAYGLNPKKFKNKMKYSKK